MLHYNRFHDGYIAESLDQPTVSMHKLFYPKYWLDATGYFNNKPNTGSNVLMFSTWSGGGSERGGVSMVFLMCMTVCIICISMLFGMYIGRKYNPMYTNTINGSSGMYTHQYQPIPEQGRV